MLGAARSTATEGDVALTERHYVQAADLFGQAAGYVPAGHPDERLGYLDRQADALYRQGDERGDNAALRSSIEVYRRCAGGKDARSGAARLGDDAEQPRHRARERWASGRAGRRGWRRRSRPIARRWRRRTRDRVPLDWAMTQMNLGNALWTLGERESGTARLEEAVAAYRAALEERTRERVPLDWAMTQMNLGNAL